MGAGAALMPQSLLCLAPVAPARGARQVAVGNRCNPENVQVPKERGVLRVRCCHLNRAQGLIACSSRRVFVRFVSVLQSNVHSS